MYISRQDFFLSGNASNIYKFLTIAVILRLVGPQQKIAKHCPHKKSELLPIIRCAARPRILSALGSATVSAVN